MMPPRVQRLWCPGQWYTVNAALDAARASGYWAGQRTAKGWRGGAPPVTLASEAKRCRQYVAALARAANLARVDRPVLALVAYRGVTGRQDADAWTWAGKVAIDGLVDAGVLESDRRDLWGVAGRCVPSVEEWGRVLRAWGLPAVAGPGLAVELREVGGDGWDHLGLGGLR